MSMGYSANFADVIDGEHVKELCPAEHKALMDAIEASGEDFEEFARDATYYDYREEFEGDVLTAYNALCEAFKKTTGGATLELAHHDSDNNGDRYDDVDGAFWCVGNLTRPTKAAKFLGKRVEESRWVTCG